MTNPGTKIKELRKLNGYSQEELGRRIGVQRAAIQKYEKGTVENIPLTTIERLANIFEVSPSYLVGWSDDNTNPLALEVKVLSGVSKFYGKDSVELLEIFVELNQKGRRKVISYARDLSKLY